jgi:hypothetical protein
MRELAGREMDGVADALAAAGCDGFQGCWGKMRGKAQKSDGFQGLIRDGMHAGRTVRRLFTMDRVDQSGWRGVKVLEVKVQKENASG